MNRTRLFFHTRRFLVTALGAGAALFASTGNAQFVISASPGLFSPSFRDASNTDAGNTTFFGWGTATGWGAAGNFKFDGLTDNDLIDNPPALQGVGGLTGTLNQVGADVILSSGNNIYTFQNTSEILTLGVPTSGTIGLGFTTIVIQGHTSGGPFGSDTPFIFPTVGGATPVVVIGTNASAQAQFWVKYTITGNAATYTIPVELSSSNDSISELQVDTKWSSSGFAADTAQAVPEPGTAALVGGAGLLILLRRRAHTQPA